MYPDTGGRRAYFGWFGTPEAESAYNEWLSELFASLAAGEPVSADRRAGNTIAENAALYLTFAKTYYANSRELSNVRDTIKMLVEYDAEMPAAKFGPNALRRFQTYLVGTNRFARSTINSHINRTRRFVKWCQSRELVPRGMTEELATVPGLRRGKTSARESRPVAPVPRAVWRATLPFMPEHVRAMVEVQYECAMRPGEVCAMTPAEIERTEPVWFFRPTHHKTAHRGHGLTKGITAKARRILEPRLSGPPDEPVFLTGHGNQFTADTFGHAVRRAARRALLANVPIHVWNPNRLRHARLTEIRDLFGEEAAQHWGGHARPDTTAIYTKRIEGVLVKIASGLESL